MDQLVVTLIVVLLPGILSSVVCDKIVVHSKWTPFKFSVYSLLLGVLSYVALQAIYYLLDMVSACSFSPEAWTHLKTWEATESDNPHIPALELAYALVLSVPVSMFAAYVINHKIFNKIARKIGVSSKYGDENLYSYYLNAVEIDWVYVRDIENNLTYQGRVVSYSENDSMQEIVLSEVTVFRYEDSSELYSVPTMYISKQVGNFVIEAVPQELLGEA
ncbi:MAG: DUF6338 family protein [Candidatus Thiodiazotropha taylori]|nr:DUF6338 family protein [Candidatus Thiodiazotropha taylori]